MDFQKDEREEVLNTIEHLKKICDKLSKKVKEIPEHGGSLYYSPALLEIEDLETETRYIKGILKEYQDSNVEYEEFP